MTVLAFREGQRPVLFNPICAEGHTMDGFELMPSMLDVLLLDKEGLLQNMSDEPILLSKPVSVFTQCEQCLEHGYSNRYYGWRLNFSVGLLVSAERLIVLDGDVQRARKMARSGLRLVPKTSEPSSLLE